MNSKTIKGLCLTTVMSLCSCDYGYNYYIQNCTKDTIVIGVSSCERIDSVYRIMQGSGTLFDIKKFSNDRILRVVINVSKNVNFIENTA